MSEIMQVDEVLALLRPMFREMLHGDELASLRLEIVASDDWQAPRSTARTSLSGTALTSARAS